MKITKYLDTKYPEPWGWRYGIPLIIQYTFYFIIIGGSLILWRSWYLNMLIEELSK